RRPCRFDALLHPVHLPAGVRELRHGVRLRPGLGAAARHRRDHRTALHPVQVLGLLRRLICRHPPSTRPELSATPLARTAPPPRFAAPGSAARSFVTPASSCSACSCSTRSSGWRSALSSLRTWCSPT